MIPAEVVDRNLSFDLLDMVHGHTCQDLWKRCRGFGITGKTVLLVQKECTPSNTLGCKPLPEPMLSANVHSDPPDHDYQLGYSTLPVVKIVICRLPKFGLVIVWHIAPMAVLVTEGSL